MTSSWSDRIRSGHSSAIWTAATSSSGIYRSLQISMADRCSGPRQRDEEDTPRIRLHVQEYIHIFLKILVDVDRYLQIFMDTCRCPQIFADIYGYEQGLIDVLQIFIDTSWSARTPVWAFIQFWPVPTALADIYRHYPMDIWVIICPIFLVVCPTFWLSTPSKTFLVVCLTFFVVDAGVHSQPLFVYEGPFERSRCAMDLHKYL